MEDYSSSSSWSGDIDHVYKKKRIVIISRKQLRNGLFQLLLLLGFVWLLLVNVNVYVNVEENHASSSTTRINHHADEQTGRIRKLEFINVVSKRKVPRGPDPIHNRRAGNSHQPPGRA